MKVSRDTVLSVTVPLISTGKTPWLTSDRLPARQRRVRRRQATRRPAGRGSVPLAGGLQ
jgi:hypothetical protein